MTIITMNLQEYNQPMYGVQEGISYGQNERVDELNDRILSRNRPDIPLAPNFDPRPIPTKYSHFPMVNRRASGTERIAPYINHVVGLNFNPATSNAPPVGYMVNVDTETVLRNQTVAMQRDTAFQGTYIPSSQSDLYHVTVASTPSVQPFPDLFDRPTFQTAIPANLEQSQIGKESFFNHTRTQLRSSI